MNALTIILSAAIGFMLSYSWLILKAGQSFKPFPFYSQMPINTQVYVDYLVARLFIAWCWVIIWQLKPLPELRVISILFILFAIDYILVYNQPYGYLSGGRIVHDKPTEGFFIPLSYSLAMGISLLVLAVIAWTKY